MGLYMQNQLLSHAGFSVALFDIVAAEVVNTLCAMGAPQVCRGMIAVFV